jgi:magnesium and cobalt transporter
MDDEIKKNQTGSYTVKASISLDDFNEYFDAEINDETVDTIGDLIMHQIGHLPKQDESVVIGNFFFKVLHSDHRRIYLLDVIKEPTQEII